MEIGPQGIFAWGGPKTGEWGRVSVSVYPEGCRGKVRRGMEIPAGCRHRYRYVYMQALGAGAGGPRKRSYHLIHQTHIHTPPKRKLEPTPGTGALPAQTQDLQINDSC